jgi:hypothetical protein
LERPLEGLELSQSIAVVLGNSPSPPVQKPDMDSDVDESCRAANFPRISI